MAALVLTGAPGAGKTSVLEALTTALEGIDLVVQTDARGTRETAVVV